MDILITLSIVYFTGFLLTMLVLSDGDKTNSNGGWALALSLLWPVFWVAVVVSSLRGLLYNRFGK